jgi:hypothetical protein
MDGEIPSASRHKQPCARSGTSATPTLLGMGYQKASGFWCRLIIGASAASPKILVSQLGAATLRPRSVVCMRRVWSNPWPPRS